MNEGMNEAGPHFKDEQTFRRISFPQKTFSRNERVNIFAGWREGMLRDGPPNLGCHILPGKAASVGRRPNGFPGLSLNDGTILFLVILLDNSLSRIRQPLH